MAGDFYLKPESEGLYEPVFLPGVPEEPLPVDGCDLFGRIIHD